MMGLNELLKEFSENKELAAKYQALGTLDTMLEQAKKDGYDISKEDVIEEMKKRKGGKLSDAELSVVAGNSTGKATTVVATWGMSCETPPISDICSIWCHK